MAKTPQTYANHARFLLPWHLIAFPILAIHVVVCAVGLFRHGISAGSVWRLFVAIALVLGVFTARSMALRVQDRLIRLEERLRLGRLLPSELQPMIETLKPRQLIALRFAVDDEVAGLVQRIEDGSLTEQKEIKQAITNWRADYLRV